MVDSRNESGALYPEGRTKACLDECSFAVTVNLLFKPSSKDKLALVFVRNSKMRWV